MADDTRDLWPERFDPPPEGELPVVILRQQAAFLGRKTKNLVEAEVKTEPAPARAELTGGRSAWILPDSAAPPEAPDSAWKRELVEPMAAELVHRFILKAPALQDYRYGLFAVYQPAVVYPLRIDFGENSWTIKSAEEFIEALRRILTAESTTRIIGALIVQSQG